jgi:hypothetical protein
LKEKEEQLQMMCVEKASLETGLFELTAQVKEDKKQIEDNWKKDVENMRSLLENSHMVSAHTLRIINITKYDTHLGNLGVSKPQKEHKIWKTMQH